MSNPSPEEREALKKAIYDKLKPRKRKFIDKIGYENWDPFQMPQDPIDIRTDHTQMTAQQLVNKFLLNVPKDKYSKAFAQGAFEMAAGLINDHEKTLGGYEFVRWYAETLGDEAKPMRTVLPSFKEGE